MRLARSLRWNAASPPTRSHVDADFRVRTTAGDGAKEQVQVFPNAIAIDGITATVDLAVVAFRHGQLWVSDMIADSFLDIAGNGSIVSINDDCGFTYTTRITLTDLGFQETITRSGKYAHLGCNNPEDFIDGEPVD